MITTVDQLTSKYFAAHHRQERRKLVLLICIFYRDFQSCSTTSADPVLSRVVKTTDFVSPSLHFPIANSESTTSEKARQTKFLSVKDIIKFIQHPLIHALITYDTQYSNREIEYIDDNYSSDASSL